LVAKTWAQKLAGGKPPHVAVLDKPFAGARAGARMWISSPMAVKAWVEGLPPGTQTDPVAMRSAFARDNGADTTCPVSSAIFLRMVAEAALDRIAAGEAPSAVTPFWRVIAPGSTIAKKLSCDGDFIATMRAMEAA
jgi:hypothetical protein